MTTDISGVITYYPDVDGNVQTSADTSDKLSASAVLKVSDGGISFRLTYYDIADNAKSLKPVIEFGTEELMLVKTVSRITELNEFSVCALTYPSFSEVFVFRAFEKSQASALKRAMTHFFCDNGYVKLKRSLFPEIFELDDSGERFGLYASEQLRLELRVRKELLKSEH